MTVLRVDTIAASGQTSENTGSVFFDGTGDYLTLANSTDFNYGSSDFSIEAWVYLVSTAGDSDNHGIASNYITSGNKRSWSFMLSGATPSFIASSDGTLGNLITVSSSVDVADDTWTHVAVSRTGTTLTIYVNGVQRAQNSSFHSSIYNNTDNPVEIGGYNNGTNTFDGYISNLRVIKGRALYTSNFTPPTEELEVVDGTVLLCCQSAINTTEEKTGKIIAAYGDKTSAGIGTTTTNSPSPIGVSTVNPGLTKKVDAVLGPVLQGDLKFNSQNFIVLPKGTSSQVGVLRDTQDVVGPDRAWYDNLVLAMPFNEATGLRDVSSRNRNPGAYGNVSISSTISKYYGSSAYFDGSGDYIDFAGSEDFALGTGDFTIEGWVNTTTFDADGGYYRRIYMTDGPTGNATGNFQIILDIDNQGRLYLWSSGSDLDFITTGSLANGNWNHFAACRSGSTLRAFVNGVLVGSTTYSIAITANSGKPRPRIGNYGGASGSGDYEGHLQDLRIYKGIAKYTANFTPPERIAEIGVGFKTGALRYNTDSNKPELYDGSQWTEVQASIPLTGGPRGVFGGGQSAISNAIDFGDLTQARLGPEAFASTTRGVFTAGYPFPSAVVGTIESITISSTGNSVNSGFNLTTVRVYFSAFSNSVRGVVAGGLTNGSSGSETNTLEYVTISSLSNSIDFGDLSAAKPYTASTSSSTRGIIGGGNTYSAPATTIINVIDYVTIMSTGNAVDFGDLSQARNNLSACSSPTRGVFGGGFVSPTNVNTLDFVTISSLGNAVDFGDLVVTREGGAACSSPTRGIFTAGVSGPANTNAIDYITFTSTGNAVDFGDRTEAKNKVAGLSNAHGGL